MLDYEIEQLQKQIAQALHTRVHPDNELAQAMNARYRQLESSKSQIK